MRFTWLVLGAVAVTLVLAAAISAAVDSGNALPSLAHTLAVRATSGGEPRAGGDGGTVPPAAADPGPQPSAEADQDVPEAEPAGDPDGDHDRGSDGGHGSDGGGRDGGRE